MAKIIRPQKGPQEKFLATSADIAIYGGAAGGGKTHGILMDPMRYMYTPGFRAVIFRKSYTQITASGGLWDESFSLYGDVAGAVPHITPKYRWTFKNRGIIYFDYIGRDEDLDKWQGSQITMLGFDELTHFTERQFFYMLSRNRSTCGVKPYVRATCNPDSDSWVAKFISWWIDQDTGYPIPERSGKIRYMARINDEITWGSSRQELIDRGIDPEVIKSVTFIASTLNDNKILMEKDPSYRANLEALPLVEKERLLKGNWKIKAAAGMFFKRIQLGDILTVLPNDIDCLVRGWDLAATDADENDKAAFTAGVLMARRKNGRFLIVDVINQQLKAGDVRKLVKQTTVLDNEKYGHARIRERLPQDPGQAGKDQAESFAQMLAGYSFSIKLESGSKQTRAEPMAALWQQGFFDIMAGEWNESYLNQLESFPESDYKDMVDAGSSAFNEITLQMGFNLENLL